jgi:hypothetical protein
MDADGHRLKLDSEDCGWLCDTASKPSTLLACRHQRVILYPKGWLLTGWYALSARRSKNTLSGFIGVHQRSSCENILLTVMRSYIQLAFSLCQ